MAILYFESSCLSPVSTHGYAGLTGDFVGEIIRKSCVFRLPGTGFLFRRIFHFRIEEFRRLAGVHLADFQAQTGGEAIVPALFCDQRFADEIPDLGKYFFGDRQLDLLTGQPVRRAFSLQESK